MKRNRIIMILTAALIVLSGVARAEQVCMDTDEMRAALIDWYGEMPVTDQVDGQQYWASAESGTWTLVMERSDGRSCVVAQGDDWQQLMAELARNPFS